MATKLLDCADMRGALAFSVRSKPQDDRARLRANRALTSTYVPVAP